MANFVERALVRPTITTKPELTDALSYIYKHFKCSISGNNRLYYTLDHHARRIITALQFYLKTSLPTLWSGWGNLQ